MGWKGALRSLEAASRRSAREYEREQKRLLKQRELNDAAIEVDDYGEVIRSLVTLHNTCLAKCDWKSISLESPPIKPEWLKDNELKAENLLNKFKPNIFHKLFRLTESKILKLKTNLQDAKEVDEDQYKNNLALYEKDYTSWQESQKISRGVLEGNIESYKEAIRLINPFDEIDEIVEILEFKPINKSVAEIYLSTEGQEVIPGEIKSLLRSGKLSSNKMPKAKYFELYQDYVCSCILRVAREIFSVLPLESIAVTILDNLLNTDTGHIENQPIISVYIHKATLNKLNLSELDPSDSMNNFICKMNFKKNKGFDVVEKISPEKIKQV